MRLSELAGKELIDIRDGMRLGPLGNADLVFEARTGRVRAIVVAPRGRWWERQREWLIPWKGVRKIGVDLIIVDLGVSLEEPGLEGGEAGDADVLDEEEDDDAMTPGGMEGGAGERGRATRGKRNGTPKGFFFRR